MSEHSDFRSEEAGENGELMSSMIYSIDVTTVAKATSVTSDFTGSDVAVDTPGCMLYSFVVSTVMIGCMCLLGIAGNTTAFFVFQKDKLKTSTSFLFQGIAVVDNLLLVTAFPIYCIRPFVAYTGLCEGYYHYAQAIVLVHVLPLAFIAQTATVWSTVLIGVNRYIAVCHPYQAARLCSVSQARLQLGVVLGFAVLYNLPKLAEARVEFDDDNVTPSNVTDPVTTTPTDFEELGLHPAYTWLGENNIYRVVYGNAMYTVFMLALPLLTLTALNFRLIRALKVIGQKRAELQRRGGRQQQAQDNNVTLVLIIVVIVFTVCQAPALVTQFLWSVLPDSQRYCGGVQFYYSQLTNLLVIANSSVNFVVYLAFNTRFRQILKQNFLCGTFASHGPMSADHSVTGNAVAFGSDRVQHNRHQTVITKHYGTTVDDAGTCLIAAEDSRRPASSESVSLLVACGTTLPCAVDDILTTSGRSLVSVSAAASVDVAAPRSHQHQLQESDEQVLPPTVTDDIVDDGPQWMQPARGALQMVLIDYRSQV